MESKFVEINGKKMHYVEDGDGEVFLFLHGNPSSSYLWRNIMPMVSKNGRAIAVDLMGMGESEKLEEYSFEIIYKYIEDFIEKLELKNIILVLHDWGSALGFHYYRNNNKNIKGIIFMEGIIKCHKSYENMGSDGEFFKSLRDPIEGRKKVINENFFIELVLQGGTIRKLKKEEHDYYRKAYLKEEDREILLMWANLVSIGGEPKNTTKIIRNYMEAIYKSKIPKLLLYAKPGAIIKSNDVEELEKNCVSLDTRYIGEGVHFIQEDQAENISNEIIEWHKNISMKN